MYSRVRRQKEDDYCYLLLDGVYLRVKGAKKARQQVALCVYGITAFGERELIDYRLAASESEVNWLVLLRDLYRRGLKGAHPELMSTDGGQGRSTRCRRSIRGWRCSAVGRTSCALSPPILPRCCERLAV